MLQKELREYGKRNNRNPMSEIRLMKIKTSWKRIISQKKPKYGLKVKKILWNLKNKMKY